MSSVAASPDTAPRAAAPVATEDGGSWGRRRSPGSPADSPEGHGHADGDCPSVELRRDPTAAGGGGAGQWQGWEQGRSEGTALERANV